MFCPRCGTQAAAAQSFCTNCGNALYSGAEPPPLPPRAPAAAPLAAAAIYASFARRTLAFILDYLIVAFLIGMISAFRPGWGELGPLYALVFVWLYKAGMESSALQASLGKLALGIKVTALDGERIGFARASGRFFAQLLSSIPLYIGYLMAGFTRRRQALHDLIAGTLVVRKKCAPAEIAHAPPAPAGEDAIAVVIIVFLGIFLIGILAAIAIPAYQDYTIRAQVSEGLSLVQPYKERVGAAIARGMDPAQVDSAAIGLGELRGRYVQDIAVRSAAFIITYGGAANPNLQGHHLVIYAGKTASGEVVFVCGHAQPPPGFSAGAGDSGNATDVDARYLPAACRERRN